MGFIIRMRPIFMVFPQPETEGLQSWVQKAVITFFHFQPKRNRHPDWAQENLDKNNGQTLLLVEDTFLKITCR